MMAVLVAVVIVFEIFMPLVVHVFLIGSNEELTTLAIFFCRITFPFILFISLTALFSGILNSLDRFSVAASSPIAGNISIIAVLCLIDPTKIAQGTSVAMAIMISGLVQLLWVAIPCWLQGIRPHFKWPQSTPSIQSFGKRMVPAAIGSGALQINLMIDVMIASLLPLGTNSYLYYADRLYQLPISITGTAMGTVLLPVLSRLWREGQTQSALHTQNRAIEFSMLITFPAMIGLMYLAEPLVCLLFERGKFDAVSTHAVAQTVFGFSTGLPAYILIKIFSSSFFARQDTLTPILTALASMVLNIIFNLILISHLKHLGIALATSLAAWGNAALLGYLLFRRHLIRFDRSLGLYFMKLAIASLITLATLIGCRTLCKPLIEYPDLWIRLTGMGLTGVGGLVTYTLCCYGMKCLKFHEYQEHSVNNNNKKKANTICFAYSESGY